MNKVILMGRLTKDPEFRVGQSGGQMASYDLAVNRQYKRDGEPDADFFRCVVFNKSAEFANKYFRKGMMVAVIGEIRNSDWTDRNGTKHRSVDIIVSEQHFAEKKQRDEFVPVEPTEGEDLPF